MCMHTFSLPDSLSLREIMEEETRQRMTKKNKLKSTKPTNRYHTHTRTHRVVYTTPISAPQKIQNNVKKGSIESLTKTDTNRSSLPW